MDTRQKIIDASIKLFSEHGYQGTSTKAIAETAGVSEMTLFRKFTTKQNLFESMLIYALGHELSESADVNMELPIKSFIRQILHQRFNLISKHIQLIQMILRESLQGRLPTELNFIESMANKLTELFQQYQRLHPTLFATPIPDFVLGSILKYAVLDYQMDYHNMSSTEQETYVSNCMRIMNLTEETDMI